jgi:hypothetical protein
MLCTWQVFLCGKMVAQGSAFPAFLSPAGRPFSKQQHYIFKETGNQRSSSICKKCKFLRLIFAKNRKPGAGHPATGSHNEPAYKAGYTGMIHVHGIKLAGRRLAGKSPARFQSERIKDNKITC